VGGITSEPRALSVVIPTWNAGELFARVLDALDAQDLEGGFQLVVVDSGSGDGTLERARAAGALVHPIPQAEFQHGRTRNLAISLAAGELIVLLTQDAVPMDAGYLRAFRAAFEQAPDGGPPIDAAYARQFPRADCDPILAERLRRWSASRDEPIVQEFAANDPIASQVRYDALAPLERLAACAFDNVASAVRRSTWELLPFPEVPFGEDVAFGKQLLLAGGRIAFLPDACVEHSHKLSIRREFKRLYSDHRNLYQLFGVRTVPTWSHAFQGWKPQSRYYAELVEAQTDLTPRERRRWKRIGHWHALSEAVAQFLGARSWWKVRESRFWRWFDRRIRRGV
jgi:rhamnosyltransferase